MNVPIENPDIRAVYVLEMFGKRSNRQTPLEQNIKRIKRKLTETLRATAWCCRKRPDERRNTQRTDRNRK